MNARRIGGNGAMLLVGMLIAFGCGMSQIQQPPDVSESEEGAARSVLDKYTAACEAKDLA